jgi:hypothetical protein
MPVARLRTRGRQAPQRDTTPRPQTSGMEEIGTRQIHPCQRAHNQSALGRQQPFPWRDQNARITPDSAKLCTAKYSRSCVRASFFCLVRGAPRINADPHHRLRACRSALLGIAGVSNRLVVHVLQPSPMKILERDAERRMRSTKPPAATSRRVLIGKRCKPYTVSPVASSRGPRHIGVAETPTIGMSPPQRG